jgi:hypothetical protein
LPQGFDGSRAAAAGLGDDGGSASQMKVRKWK